MDCLTLYDGADTLFRNVANKLPINAAQQTYQKTEDLITNRSLISDNINDERKELRNVTSMTAFEAKGNVSYLSCRPQDLWFCYSQRHGHYLDSKKCHKSVMVAHMSTTKSGLFVVLFFQKVPGTGDILQHRGDRLRYTVSGRRIILWPSCRKLTRSY